MAGIRSLAKDTAVYGLSSIVGRFLNWCLVPLYVYMFPTEEYGIVSYLYSFTAVALVILNYGMETGYFRYASRSEDPDKVYTTSLISVGFTSLLFMLLLSIFIVPVSELMLLPDNSLFVWLLGMIVAIDAFTNIPFAYLRFKKRACRFAGIKLLNVGLNIGLNLLFILGCPALMQGGGRALVSWFYEPLGGQTFGIGWIFLANMISTLMVFVCLLPELPGRKWRFDAPLLKKMLSYSWPLLILGVAGILSQNMGQIIIPYIFAGQEEAARSMVGIYGANIKIAIVMVMFTQAFRYAYEPFIFAQAGKDNESRTAAYADAMKFFVIFGLFIFLAVMYFLPVIKYFVSPDYWAGLSVVPLMMVAEFCFGIFFNLSVWYKVTDRTQWGMWMSLICFALMLGLNLWLVPAIGIPDGYMGSAMAALASYFAVMLISYFIGRHYYPIPYQIGRLTLYVLLAAILYAAGYASELVFSSWALFLTRTLMLVLYLGVVCCCEDVPGISPMLRRLAHKAHPDKKS